MGVLGTATFTSIPKSQADSPVNIFGTIFGEMIRRDMEVRQQRNAEAIIVRRIQTALQRLGYYQGAIDGNFGAGTQAAFAAYRRDRNIPLEAAISQYDIADLEAQARNQPYPSQQTEADDQEQGEPAVQYSAVTPQSAWAQYRFSEFDEPLNGPIVPPEGTSWIIVASALSYENVIDAALKYAQDFPGTIIVKSNNGRYGILIGWLPKPEAKQLLNALKTQSIVPEDAFLSSGQKFVGPVWTTASSSLKTRNDLFRYGFLRASAHLWDRVLNGPSISGFGEYRYRVVNVTASDGTQGFLSLRKAGEVSAPEVTRMFEGTLLNVTETRNGWSRVKLLDGREGWANARYLASNSEVLSGGSDDEVVVETSAPDTSPYGDKDLQDRLLAEGTMLLQTTDRFLKTNPGEVSNITAFADAALRLKTALSARDFGTIEASTAALQQLLSGSPSFKKFEEDVNKERERAEREELDRAQKLADENTYFLKSYIALHLTATETSTLSSLLKELVAAQQSHSLATLNDVNQRIEAAVSQYGLGDQKADILKRYVPPLENQSEVAQGPAPDTSSVPEPTDQNSPQKQEELRRITEDAEGILGQLDRFAKTGSQAIDPLQTGRLVANLRQSLKSRQAAAILRDSKALGELLSKDQEFTEFQRKELDARKLEEVRKREAATNEARRLIAFTEHYITENYTSERLDVLLDILEQLRSAIKGGEGPDLFHTVDDAHVRLGSLGLQAQLDAFRVDNPAQESVNVAKCRELVQQAQWSFAAEACTAALEEDRTNTEIAALQKSALDALDREKQTAEQEKQKLEELKAARANATGLLDELSRYSASGGKLADAIAIARIASKLKAAIAGQDAGLVTATSGALAEALQKDKSYLDFRKSQNEQASELETTVRSTQVAESKRLRFFIASVVSRDVTAAGVGDLLAADDELAKALESPDAVELRRANEAVTRKIVTLGFESELAAYELPVERPPEVKACLSIFESQDWKQVEANCSAALLHFPTDPALAPVRQAIEKRDTERKEREAQERLLTGRKQADELLLLIEAFAKTGQTFKDQGGMVGGVADLRRGLAGNNGAALLHALDVVRAALKADDGFSAFVARRDEETRRNEYEALADARSEARRIRAFIDDYLKQNISSTESPALTDRLKSLDEAIAGSSLIAVKEASSSASNLLGQLGLGGKLKEFSLAPKQVSLSPVTSNEIVIDGKNRQLLQGNSGDFVVLFNNSSRARNVRRDVFGRLAFSDTVQLCWYHTLPKPGLGTRMTYQALRAAGAKEINLSGPCEDGKLDDTDIVALQRGDFLTGDRQYVKRLVDRFVAGVFVPVATVTAEEVHQRQAADDLFSKTIADDLRSGRSRGYGVLAVHEESKSLCMSSVSHYDVLKFILSPRLEALVGELAGSSLHASAGADDAFRSVRGGECDSVILDAQSLNQFMIAAKRENISYRILPLWIDDREIAATEKRIESDEADRLRVEEDRKLEADNAKKQEEIREQTLGETKRKEEADLRSRFGTAARGLAANIADSIKRYVVHPDDPATREIALLFGRFSQWYQTEFNSGWEMESDGFETELMDYGTVQWQGRDVEVVFIRVNVRMKHRDLGKYQTTCFDLGAVVDAEFKRYRDTFEAYCADTNGLIVDWKTARRFSSRWIAQ